MNRPFFSIVMAMTVIGGCVSSHETRESSDGADQAQTPTSSPPTLNAGENVEQDGIELAVLESSDERLSVRASDESASVIITLAKGSMRPINYVGDVALDGYFEGDVMVESEEGYPFLLQIGGDELVDESWRTRLDAGPGSFDIEQRKSELSLATRSAEILANVRVGEEHKRLARDLAGHARLSLHEWTTDGAPQGDEQPSTVLPDTIDKAAAVTYVHQVFIRRGNCCWAFGEHSSTRLKIFNNAGGLVADISTNNHGRNATDASLTTAAGCPDSWSGRTNKFPPFQPHKHEDLTVNGISGGGSGGCKTSYGVASGQHVCNDDSLAEYTNVARNQAMIWATCNDSGLRSVAPRCN